MPGGEVGACPRRPSLRPARRGRRDRPALAVGVRPRPRQGCPEKDSGAGEGPGAQTLRGAAEGAGVVLPGASGETTLSSLQLPERGVQPGGVQPHLPGSKWQDERTQSKLRLRRFRVDAIKNLFIEEMIRYWNELPREVRSHCLCRCSGNDGTWGLMPWSG